MKASIPRIVTITSIGGKISVPHRLTALGRKQLETHTNNWDRLVRAVNRVLRPAEE